MSILISQESHNPLFLGLFKSLIISMLINGESDMRLEQLTNFRYF